MMHIIRITENCSIPSAKRTCERTIGKVAGRKKVYAYEVLRSDYESIDVQTGKINGSFDVDLGKVSGGGLLSSHSSEEFEAAGVEVIGWGYMYNDGYKLKSTGEDLEMGSAHWVVIFYKEQGRPAKSRAEIIAYNDAYNAGNSWTDSGNWG